MFKTRLIFLIFILVLSFNQSNFAQKKRPKTVTRKEIISVIVKAKPEPEVSTANLSEAQKLRLETFRTVWKIIDDFYFDRTFNGLNWHKLKYETELQVVALKTDFELYALLNNLVGRLNASHFAIVPPEYIREIENVKKEAKAAEKKIEDGDKEKKDADEDEDESGDDDELAKSLEEYDSRYGIGAEVKILNREIIITHISKNSAAEKAGLKIGYAVKKINGVSLDDFIARLLKFESSENRLLTEIPVYIKSFLFNGEKDSAVVVTYDDGSGQNKDVLIKREKLDGELIKIISNMPRQFLEFETKSLDDETGYIKFNVFTVKSVEKFCSAITQLKDKKNLIIDLRGNIGGSFGALFGIAGLLVQEKLFLGTEISIDTQEQRMIEPHVKNFKGKVAVLIDNTSLSAAEILSAGLQESGRAVLIGETSGGQALPSIVKLLPTGAVFQYPVSNFKTAKGKILEGKGVTPDVTVALDKNQLLGGTDNQLDRAISYIEKLEKLPAANAKTDVPKTAETSKNPPAKIAAPNIVRKTAVKEKYDPKALEIIENYVAAIGGAENLRKIETLKSEGSSVITRAGAQISGGFRQIRNSSGKNSDTYMFDGVGDVSEIFDGEKFFVQTQVNGIQNVELPVKIAELKLEKDFLELVNVKSVYRSVAFLGNFERLGGRVNLIDVKNADGSGFVLAFDAKTNLLVQRTGIATDVSFGDYRKVGDYLFPFKMSQAGLVEIELDSVKINEKIDDISFTRKTSCFDKID